MIRAKAAPIWTNIDVVLSTVILLGIGPEIQLIVDASLSQRRDTLYESAYGDYMVVDASVIDTYLSLYSIPYLACGLLLSFIIRAKTYQDFAIFSAAAAFVMWMLYDGILGQFGLGFVDKA
ncbi:MAG: hypothetical protein DI591_12550 [Citromicrobium sp.]|nr:MAG: hypothetical protein DI591_12550 [Citromicrobium sp.]